MKRVMSREEYDLCTGRIIDSAIDVHRGLGPGILESAYQACLEYELTSRGMSVVPRLEMPVVYRGVRLDLGYRLDLLVEDAVVVEIKAIAKVLPIHEAQLLSYLRLGDYRVGLLINFHVPRLKDGIRRLVNGL